MFNEGRWIASAVYIVTMILTILAAVLLKNGIAVIFCCLIQYVAMWWYFLSYIPFARDCVKNAISGRPEQVRAPHEVVNRRRRETNQ
ncbi:hypothetical protein AGDE_05376 [Angomonas deanei]|nr:hypothetical protein AGDE_05376 [Angomonas deanei]|eukprot:EPY38553.1 hypothetical protein AGDE_05376 [Angomonas deanei]